MLRGEKGAGRLDAAHTPSAKEAAREELLGQRFAQSYSATSAALVRRVQEVQRDHRRVPGHDQAGVRADDAGAGSHQHAKDFVQAGRLN